MKRVSTIFHMSLCLFMAVYYAKQGLDSSAFVAAVFVISALSE